MTRVLLLIVAALLASASPLASSSETQGEGTLWENAHYKYVTNYEGTKSMAPQQRCQFDNLVAR